MKVLFVTPYLGLSYGGTSRVVLELARSLGKLNVDIDIVSTNANDGKKLNVQHGIWLNKDNYRVRYFPAWHQSDLIISFSLIHWLKQHIKEYEIVHTHTLFSPLISLTHTLCWHYQVPYVATPHGMLDPWALSYKAWKKSIYYTHFEKPLIRNASLIQTLSKPEAKQVTQLGYIQTTTIPNGIHRNEFEPLPDSDFFYKQFPYLRNQKLILFLGRIDPKKGLDLLAPAFAKVNEAFPNTHLVVAGPDSIGFLPMVKKLFYKCQLSRICHFHRYAFR